MDNLLEQIKTRLIAAGLTVENEGHFSDGYCRWYVADHVDETCVYVLISKDRNGHPQFWCECPNSVSTTYITPIYTKIGDARDEVVGAHVTRRRGIR